MHGTFYRCFDRLLGSWIINEFLNYYLIHKQECFIRYKKSVGLRPQDFFISDRTRAARVLNGLKYSSIFNSCFGQS